MRNALLVSLTLALAPSLANAQPSKKQKAKARKQVGIATKFFPVEEHNNGKFACTGRTPLFPASKLRRWRTGMEDLPLCAHRTIPCGTWVWVQNVKTKAGAWCVVGDRGPYGALTPDGDWVLKLARNPDTKDAEYRAVIDLSPGVAKKVGTKGWARVRIHWWRDKKIIQPIITELKTRFIRKWHR